MVRLCWTSMLKITELGSQLPLSQYWKLNGPKRSKKTLNSYYHSKGRHKKILHLANLGSPSSPRQLRTFKKIVGVLGLFWPDLGALHHCCKTYILTQRYFLKYKNKNLLLYLSYGLRLPPFPFTDIFAKSICFLRFPI